MLSPPWLLRKHVASRQISNTREWHFPSVSPLSNSLLRQMRCLGAPSASAFVLFKLKPASSVSLLHAVDHQGQVHPHSSQSRSRSRFSPSTLVPHSPSHVISLPTPSRNLVVTSRPPAISAEADGCGADLLPSTCTLHLASSGRFTASGYRGSLASLAAAVANGS